ncbi:MAG: hypothetical protein V2I74_01230 [Erythrobacter sp.]|nr:hypothetical protein [Erythrobacter sp.]
MLGARTLPGNPNDGHSLAGQIDQVARLTGRQVRRPYVDRGYHGPCVTREGLQVVLSRTSGIVSPSISQRPSCAPSPPSPDRAIILWRVWGRGVLAQQVGGGVHILEGGTQAVAWQVGLDAVLLKGFSEGSQLHLRIRKRGRCGF